MKRSVIIIILMYLTCLMCCIGVDRGVANPSTKLSASEIETIVRTSSKKHFQDENAKAESGTNRVWRDPHKMFPYEPDKIGVEYTAETVNSASLRKELDNCKHEVSVALSSDDKSDAVSESIVRPNDENGNSVDFMYFRRFVTIIGNKLKYEESSTAITIQLSTNDVSTLKKTAEMASSNKLKDLLDDYVILIKAAENLSINTSYSVNDNFLNLCSGMYYIAVVLGSILCMFLMYNVLKNCRWDIFVLLFVIFIITLSVDFMYLYQMEVTAREHTILKGIPAHCVEKNQGWLNSIYNYFWTNVDDRVCLEYYQSVNVDPLLKVTVGRALTRSLATFIFSPLEVALAFVKSSIISLMADLPFFIYIPVIIVTCIIFVIFAFGMFGYSFRSMFFSIVAPMHSPFEASLNALNCILTRQNVRQQDGYGPPRIEEVLHEYLNYVQENAPNGSQQVTCNASETELQRINELLLRCLRTTPVRQTEAFDHQLVQHNSAEVRPPTIETVLLEYLKYVLQNHENSAEGGQQRLREVNREYSNSLTLQDHTPKQKQVKQRMQQTSENCASETVQNNCEGRNSVVTVINRSCCSCKNNVQNNGINYLDKELRINDREDSASSISESEVIQSSSTPQNKAEITEREKLRRTPVENLCEDWQFVSTSSEALLQPSCASLCGACANERANP